MGKSKASAATKETTAPKAVKAGVTKPKKDETKKAAKAVVSDKKPKKVVFCCI